MARAVTASSSTGSPGIRSDSTGRASDRIANILLTSLSPEKGGVPVSAWQSTAARA